MMIDVKALLDICDITYTEKQLLILEKLVDDLLQQHIKEAINDFYDNGTTSNLDVKLENEILSSDIEIDESYIVVEKIEEVNSFKKDKILIKQDYSEEDTADIKLEGLTHEVNERVIDKGNYLEDTESKTEEVNSSDEDEILIKQDYSEEEIKGNERVIDKENCVEDTESLLHNLESVQKNETERKMCTSCGMGFDNGITLKEHLQTIHDIFTCKIVEHGNTCEHIFNDAKTLCEHIQQAHRIYTCNICKQQLFSIEALKKHNFVHHEYSCSSCGETLTLYTSTALYTEKQDQK